MLVRKKIAIALLALIFGGAAIAAAYYYFIGDGENLLSDPVEDTSLYFPYTGLKADNEEATKYRPLCIKIPNDSKARPQTGINNADVVYETMVEGGETRLNAIFQSNLPEDVGPIRSARLSDIWIVPQYNGMLFFSGANSQVRGEISSHNITDMRWDNAQSIFFRANNGRGNLHNLHVELNKAYEVAEGRGYEIKTENPIPLHFSGVKYNEVVESDSKLDTSGDGSPSGSALQVKIAGNTNIEFKWDDEKARYLKWMNGVEHCDDATGEDVQVNVVNVVVMWAEYVQQTKVDAAGSPTYDTILGGTGKAAVFKNGRRFDCEWNADETTPPRFIGADGKEILLDPGNTWIVVPPETTKITSE